MKTHLFEIGISVLEKEGWKVERIPGERQVERFAGSPRAAESKVDLHSDHTRQMDRFPAYRKGSVLGGPLDEGRGRGGCLL